MSLSAAYLESEDTKLFRLKIKQDSQKLKDIKARFGMDHNEIIPSNSQL